MPLGGLFFSEGAVTVASRTYVRQANISCFGVEVARLAARTPAAVLVLDDVIE
jgi:hypothetical protein